MLGNCEGKIVEDFYCTTPVEWYSGYQLDRKPVLRERDPRERGKGKMTKIIATDAPLGAVVFSPTIFGEVPSNRVMATHDLPATYRMVWGSPAPGQPGSWVVGPDA